ncbi:Hypothetical protein RY67_1659 [Bifidobacterium longum subsp. infantis]|uniref:Uncharacterized protein n=1 Tax=Bifidobacterium longum subsp. infantis TaxID=1682 RepID=A0A0M3T6B6_BIFLI|nr:Hypothetical protein RY67_1659 [Bifidobacterium longum subsp. infantis]
MEGIRLRTWSHGEMIVYLSHHVTVIHVVIQESVILLDTA